jgi:hypothetical protein
MAVLEANGLMTTDLKTFVKQDVESIFKKISPVSEKIAKTFTDIGAVADKVLQGGKFEIRKIKHGKFEVVNIDTGKIHAKSTTLRNAKSQVKLLNAMDHGFKPSKTYTWKDLVKSEMKGKSFSSKAEVNDYMKKLSEKWKNRNK